MEASFIFARVYAIYFIVIGIALLLYPKRFRNWYSEIMRKPDQVMLGAILSLLIGSFIVATHNVWVLDWPILITIIGWWGIIWAATLLISPNSVGWHSFMTNSTNTTYRASGVFWVLLGLYLGYHGFIAV
jgi:uncharacterized protein YjeT (DUF2065 family)